LVAAPDPAAVDVEVEVEAMPQKLSGASVWEEELYEHLTSHVENERDLLLAYQRASAESGSSAFGYLAALIVEDEIRHHRMFEDLAEALRSGAELRPVEPRVPRLDWSGEGERILELAGRLIKQEERDARELRHLAKTMKDVKDTTLWRLIVRLMEMDTEKHLEILNFVRTHAGS
jgi:hypothetical protein